MKLACFSTILLAGLFLHCVCWAQGRPMIAEASSPRIGLDGVFSASAFGAFTSVAPGSWIEIYGSKLANDTRSWAASEFNGVNAPTSLAGTSVTIGSQPAFVAYVSPSQVNVQVPSGVGAGPQPLIVTADNVPSSPYILTVDSEEPGLLAPTAFKIGGKQHVAALFLDGKTYVLPPDAIAGVPSRRAQPGDTITLYGVGFGPVTPDIPAGQIVQHTNVLASSFQLKFGPAPATVTYAGLAPDAVGLYQFNVTVPAIASSDAVPLTFTLDGAAGAQALYISVQNGDTAAQAQSLTLSPASVAGEETVEATVVISEPAPAGGARVELSSGSSAATVPSTVTVPEGATSTSFSISTGAVGSNQTATLTATYGGSSAQATLSVTQAAAPANAAFVSLAATLAFQPAGHPSSDLFLLVTPDSGAVTFAATITPELTLTNGTASNKNQTFTSNDLQPGASAFIIVGGTLLRVSSASLNFTLKQLDAGDGFATGSVTGTLSLKGTPYPTGGASVTVSGPIFGDYSATLPSQ
jgi:uncharacterized protein (TIGR03437 family)